MLLVFCFVCRVLFHAFCFTCRAGRGTERVRPTGQNRALIEGLPSGTSWQDLKDFMKKPADVAFCDVTDGGRGVSEKKRAEETDWSDCCCFVQGWVEYRTEDDLERAIKELDGAKYRGEHAIRVTKVFLVSFFFFFCLLFDL
jgi:hypothetical protein